MKDSTGFQRSKQVLGRRPWTPNEMQQFRKILSAYARSESDPHVAFLKLYYSDGILWRLFRNDRLTRIESGRNLSVRLTRFEKLRGNEKRRLSSACTERGSRDGVLFLIGSPIRPPPISGGRSAGLAPASYLVPLQQFVCSAINANPSDDRVGNAIDSMYTRWLQS